MMRLHSASSMRLRTNSVHLHAASRCVSSTRVPIVNKHARVRPVGVGASKQPSASTTQVAAASRSSQTAVAKVGESAEDELSRLRTENALLKSRLAEAGLSVEVPAAAPPQPGPTAQPVATAPEHGMDAAASAAAAASPASTDETEQVPSSLRAGIQWPTPTELFWDRPARSSSAPPIAGSSSIPPATQDPRPLHIVHITAEMAPIAKVGGLGDVVTGLARACLARGHNVVVMLPFYESLPKEHIADLQHERDFDVFRGTRWDGAMQLMPLLTSVWSGRIAGCPVLLVRPADWSTTNIFKGGRIYGGSYNEMEAYLYFCRACLEFLKVTGQQPHVLQLHDWHASAAALLYWDIYNAQGLWKPRLMLTIHNLENTGEVRQDEFFYSGLDGERFASADKALDERTIGHNPERINLMKGALVYCNAVTTVSPTYAKEVLQGGAAGWLNKTFARQDISSKFRGILNGIDTDEWDPATDPLLPAPFSSAAPDGKALCKEFVQRGLGLDVDARKPLVVVISRLVPQKGIHLIKATAYRTLEKGGQFVLLGSGHSDPVFRGMAAKEFAGHQSVCLKIMYSERLAHQLYGAADFVVVPSMFEPCGLTQLIAIRYGAVPIVRRTGGLADTVFDVDSAASGSGNGYVFDGSDDQSLHGALDRALAMYHSRPEDWAQLSQRNLRADVSWSTSGKHYVDLYSEIAVKE